MRTLKDWLAAQIWTSADALPPLVGSFHAVYNARLPIPGFSLADFAQRLWLYEAYHSATCSCSLQNEPVKPRSLTPWAIRAAPASRGFSLVCRLRSPLCDGHPSMLLAPLTTNRVPLCVGALDVPASSRSGVLPSRREHPTRQQLWIRLTGLWGTRMSVRW